MNIKYGEDELDLDTIHSPDDILAFISNIKGQAVSVFLKEKEYPPSDNEILFDECTDKEKALRNLHFELNKEYHALKKRLFPSSTANLILMAKQTGQKDMLNIPAVDTEEDGNLQKLAYARELVHVYVSMLMQARVGFGLSLSVSNNGQIHVLRDLRELFTKAV